MKNDAMAQGTEAKTSVAIFHSTLGSWHSLSFFRVFFSFPVAYGFRWWAAICAHNSFA